MRTGWLVLAILGGATACGSETRPDPAPEGASDPAYDAPPAPPPDAVVAKAPPPPRARPTLPDTIGNGDPDAILSYDAEEAAAEIPDAPRTPVTLAFKMSAAKDLADIDVESAFLLGFRLAGLDVDGTDPVARIDVKCRTYGGPKFLVLGGNTTWTRVSCAMVVKPARGKQRAFSIEAGVPRTVAGGLDEASRAHFLDSYGAKVLPELAAVALGRAEEAPRLASLAVGLSREQRIGVLPEVIAPYVAALPPSLRACVDVAQRKFKDAAALGEEALPALWQLLSSDWATAETVPAPAVAFQYDVHAVQALVAQRLPAVKALATIGGVRAGVLAALVARDLPVAGPDDDDVIESFDPRAVSAIDTATIHPGREEGKLLVVLLKTIVETDPPGGAEVLALFAKDHRRDVRTAATAP